MVWYTVTPSSFHPRGSAWRKRRVVNDIKVALYAQTFPPFWILPSGKTDSFKWVGEAFPPLYARYLFMKHNAPEGKLLDLFAGIGGWSLGYVLADLARYIEMVEADRMKCNYLKLNFKRLKKFTEGHTDVWDFNVVCKDIRKYEPEDKFDVVVGSPPCEDYSRLRALSRAYGKEIAGSLPLTKEYIKIVDKIRPKLALYENVYAKPLAMVLETFGYTVRNENMFPVIPQHRQRLIAFKGVIEVG